MINNTERQAGPYIGDSATTYFPFAFKVFQASDVKAVYTLDTGFEAVLVLGKDYQCVLNADQNTNPGGYVSLTSSLPIGYKLTITSDVQELQPTDIKNLGGFYPKVINDSLDRLTMLVQQVSGTVKRTLKFPISGSGNGELPDSVSLKGRTLAFDVYTGTPVPGPTVEHIESVEGIAKEISSLYIGAYDTDPIVDKFGNPLVEGALYFNTVYQLMHVYTGVEWIITYGANADVVGSFGKTHTPDNLPVDGFFPRNWDWPGVPSTDLQLNRGQSMIYLPNDKSDPLYNQAYIFVTQKFSATGWQNAGVFQGPEGPKGDKGDKGDDGASGPTGPQGPVGSTGPKGDTGATGPTGPQGPVGPVGAAGPAGVQGPQGIQGPIGPQGNQGSPGASCTIIGSFGASKTSADLPLSGLIPANWDAPGNPAAQYQMKPGEALIFTDCPKGTANYGHVYEYLPDSVSIYDLNNWIDLGDIVGPQGPQGIQGQQGPAGAAGQQGLQGPQGLTGLQGATGATGATGPQGPAGSNGADGKPNVLQIGTVKEGTAADATITGTSPSQTLNLVLPRGPQGQQGIQGPVGEPATGGGSDKIFMMNDKTITTNYTIPSNKNAGTFGPVKTNDGVTVTVSDGSFWTIV